MPTHEPSFEKVAKELLPLWVRMIHVINDDLEQSAVDLIGTFSKIDAEIRQLVEYLQNDHNAPETAQLTQSLHEILFFLQFQDRVSQALTHLGLNISLLQKQTLQSETAIDVSHIKKTLISSRTTDLEDNALLSLDASPPHLGENHV